MKRLLISLTALLLVACAAHHSRQTEAQREEAQIDAFLAAIGAVPEPVDYQKFDTMEEAAVAALKNVADHASPVLQNYEWGGAIGKTEAGKYVYSTPDTNYQGDSVMVSGRGLPPDAEAVAGYHTHPCIPEHEVEYFSPEDLLTVIFARKAAAFMGDYCTGNVHEFKRGDQPDVLALQGGVWLTKGRIIGQFTTPHALPKIGV